MADPAKAIAARISAVKTGSTRLPNIMSACPTMPAATLVFPNTPLSHIAATPLANSTSPTGRISSGPRSRYIELASMYTVAMILWPLPVSVSRSSSKYRHPGRCHKW
jgi:hypothetical protein